MLSFAAVYGFGPWYGQVSSLSVGMGCGASMTGQGCASEGKLQNRTRAGTTNAREMLVCILPNKAEEACGGCIQLSKAGRAISVSPWLLYNVPETALAAESEFTLSASYIWRQAACGSCAGAGPGLSPSSQSWIPGSTRDGRSGAMKEP